MKRLLPLPLLLLIVWLPVQAQTTLTGTIKGADGSPMPLAHLHLFAGDGTIGSAPIRSIEVNKDGTYSLTVSEPGFYNVGITGVNHTSMTFPLAVGEKAQTIRMDARPMMLGYDEHPKEVGILGEWNDFDFSKIEAMEGREDGTFIYTLKTGKNEVRYQLVGIAVDGGPRSVNAPNSDGYVYDGGGDYRSILRVKPGEVTITFDPRDLPHRDVSGDNQPFVQFDDPVHAQLWEIANLNATTDRDFMAAVIDSRQNGTAIDVRQIWGTFAELMSDFMNEENDIRVRRYAALSTGRALRYSRDPKDSFVSDEALQQIRELLPAESPMWAMNPALATVIAQYGREDANEAILEIARNNPDHKVQGIALSQVALNEHMAGNLEKAVEYYYELEDNYGDIEDISYVMTRLNPDKRIQNGKSVPEFELALLGGSDASGATGNGMVSNKSMLGKYYLIDFWATWCGPCVGEMPGLHQAYEDFGGDKFEILSISFDATTDDIAKFRDKRFKMPWLHAFAEGNFNSALAQTFEVAGIPKPVLVDPNGKIVAMQEELRGEKLHETLARYLGDGQASR